MLTFEVGANIRKYSSMNILKMSTSSIQAAKATLREEVQKILGKLTTEEKKIQSKIVFDKIVNLDAYKNSNRISIFLSTDDEVSTEPMVRKIFEDGKQCFVPRYSKAGMEMVKLHSMEDWDTLPLTPWKIKQPSLKEKRENALETGGLDLVIAPGVAFSKEGKRLGHGGGYYDKFVKGLRGDKTKKVTIAAIAFKEQVMDDIPTHEHDELVDEVIYAE